MSGGKNVYWRCKENVLNCDKATSLTHNSNLKPIVNKTAKYRGANKSY